MYRETDPFTEATLRLWVVLAWLRLTSTVQVFIIYNDIHAGQIEAFAADMKNCNGSTCWNSSLVTIFQKNSIFDSPSTLLNSTSALQVGSKESLVIFSFINHPQQAFLQGIFEPMKNVTYYPFSTSLEEMFSFTTDKDEAKCLKLTASYRKALAYILYSLYATSATVITEEHFCATQFYSDLSSTVEATSLNNDIRIQLQHVSFTSTDTGQLFSDLYSIKTHATSVIIPVLPASSLSIVFQMGSYFSLLSPEHLWVIPEYFDGLVSTIVPSRILTFSENTSADSVDANPYQNLQKAVPRLFTALLDEETETNRWKVPGKLSPKVLYAFNSPSPRLQFRLDIRYRNLADTHNDWMSTEAQVMEDGFLVQGSTLPMLRSITGGSTSSFLRVVTILDAPYTMMDPFMYDPVTGHCTQGIVCRYGTAENSTVYKSACCYGFLMEIFDLLVADLNLKADVYIVPDGYYGAVESNGEWNGLIGEIQHGRADLALAGLAITGERSAVVDFTVPYYEAEMGILLKPKTVELSFVNWEFIAPLSPSLQLVLWFMVVGAMVLNFLFENDYFFLALVSRKYYQALSLYPPDESMTYITGVFLQRELGGRNPQQLSSRVHAVVFAFAMAIVVTTYTAVLAAWSVQSQNKSPFLGSKDSRLRNPSDSFKFATLKSSSYSTFFKNADNPVIQRMGRFMSRYNVDSTAQGVERVRNGQLDAFIDDYEFLHYYISRDSDDCTLRLYSDPLMKSGYAFAFSKDHRMLALFNNLMQQYREDELTLQLYKKWIVPHCEGLFTNTQKRLTPENFGGLIVLLPCTIFACILMLCPEHFYHRIILKKLYAYVEKFSRRTGRGRGLRLTRRSAAYQDGSNIVADFRVQDSENNDDLQKSAP